jgi:hypothetical protein
VAGNVGAVPREGPPAAAPGAVVEDESTLDADMGADAGGPNSAIGDEKGGFPIVFRRPAADTAGGLGGSVDDPGGFAVGPSTLTADVGAGAVPACGARLRGNTGGRASLLWGGVCCCRAALLGSSVRQLLGEATGVVAVEEAFAL